MYRTNKYHTLSADVIIWINDHCKDLNENWHFYIRNSYHISDSDCGDTLLCLCKVIVVHLNVYVSDIRYAWDTEAWFTILKVPQTRSTRADLMMCQFKCGCLFSVVLQTRIEALSVREDLYFNQKCQFNQADALLYMLNCLVCPL